MNLGKGIKLARGRAFSQKEIAQLTGVTTSYVCKLEKGKNGPSLAWLNKYSLAVNVSVPVIFYMAMDDEDATSGMEMEYMVMKPQIDELFMDCFGVYGL